MRALLVLILVLAVVAPASADTWQPRSSFSTYGQVGVGPDGTTLIGWPTWNDDLGRSEVRYRRVADDGSFGPEILAGWSYLSRCCAQGRGSAGPAVIDGDGNATLIFSFLDGTKYYTGEPDCCHRYEMALLDAGATLPLVHRRFEPSGRDRAGLQVAVAPGGARVGAWMIVRPNKPGRIIQVLDAPPGHVFGPPLTIADEPVQDGSGFQVVAERGRAAWVLWTTERERAGEILTAVRVARRGPGERRWRLRTLARGTRADGAGLRIEGSSLDAAAGRDGELLVGWDECDGDGRFGPVTCRVRARWRHAGVWQSAETASPDGVASGRAGMAIDRRGRALVAFATCEDSQYDAAGCTIQMARGRDGALDPATDLGVGRAPYLAANRRGHVMLLYATGEYGPPGHDYARYARAGTIAGGFESPERIDLGYMTSCCSHAADDQGNFSFTAGGYDGGTYLLRYRR